MDPLILDMLPFCASQSCREQVTVDLSLQNGDLGSVTRWKVSDNGIFERIGLFLILLVALSSFFGLLAWGKDAALAIAVWMSFLFDAWLIAYAVWIGIQKNKRGL